MAISKPGGEGGGHDRYTLGPSDDQAALVAAVIDANPKTALVLVNGWLISIDGLKESAPAILNAFMPGVHGRHGHRADRAR